MGLKEGDDLQPNRTDAVAEVPPIHVLRPYQQPAFRFERVFETMALACGKISPTQSHCRFNRKSS